MAIFAPTDFGDRLAMWVRNDELGTVGATMREWLPPSTFPVSPTWYMNTATPPTVLGTRTPAGGKSWNIPVAENHNGWLRHLYPWQPNNFYPSQSNTLADSDTLYGAWGWADGTLNTNQQQSNAIPCTFFMRMVTPVAATSYTIYRHNSFPTYAPANFTFEGSNNGTSWTTLDTRTGVTWAATSNNFTFSNSTSYAYYRLVVTATGGGAQIIISEFTINGVANTQTNANFEIYLVLKSLNTAADSPRAWEFGNSGSQKHYWYLASQHYEDFGTNVRQVYNPTISLNAWHVLHMRSVDVGGGNSQFSIDINGVQQYVSPAAARSWPIEFSTWALNVEAAEVVALRGQVSRHERQRTLGYLVAKHGLQNSVAASPLNNDFMGQTVTGIRILGAPSNTGGYTTQGSEPLTLPVSTTGWATFIPQVTGLYTIDTSGSDFDTAVAVYTGSALGSLSLVASDDGSGTSGVDYATAIMADPAPAFYWKMDETSGTTANDSSGNSRNGTHTSVTVNQTSLVGSGVGKSCLWNGTSALTAIAYASWMNGYAYSVVCRIQPDSAMLTGNQYIIGRWSGAGTTNVWLFYLASGKLKLEYTNPAGTSQTAVVGATTLVAGTTYTVGFTWDGVKAEVFLNGVSDGSQTPGFGTGVGQPTSEQIEIGRAAHSLFGKVTLGDEFAYYTDALTPERHAQIHARLAASGAVVNGKIASVSLTAGTAYRIQVGAGASNSGSVGSAVLSITPAGLGAALIPNAFLAATQTSPALLLKGRTTKAFDAAAGG